jgi:hypothetical protein
LGNRKNFSLPGIEVLFLGCHKVQCTFNGQQAATPVILVTAPNKKETLQQFLHRHTTNVAPQHLS